MTATAPAPQQQAPPATGSAQDRERWIQTTHEYEVALARAVKVWTANHPPEVLNAVAATLLIHFNRLRENEDRKKEKEAERNRPAGGGRPQQQKPQGAQYTGPIPSCPWCQGPTWDNRTSKKSPAMPDFRCKDKGCVDEAGRIHGIWIDKKTGRLKLPDVEDEGGY